jgi:hypothetical protein
MTSRCHPDHRVLLLGCALLLACNEGSVGSGTDAAADGGPADAALDAPRDQLDGPDATAGDGARRDAGADAAGPGDATGEGAALDAVPADLSGDATSWLASVSCSTPPPPGAQLAAPLPTYRGTCPTLTAGSNTLTSSGARRRFILVLPSKILPGERFPVLFMWHWLKGSASSFLKKGEIQKAADQQRFIGVIPEAKGDLSLFGLIELPWPFATFNSNKRMAEEYTFFDDMLACVGAQYKVNKECVSTAGVSAGALFTVQLAGARSRHLSSFISLSGGIGSGGIVNSFIRTWTSPAHKMPALVLWGGPLDSCILLNFQSASVELQKKLTAANHFQVECIHNCRHGEPPVVPPPGKSRYGPLWDFAFDHPYWLKPNQSPLQVSGWDKSIIPWCGIGAGSAKIRTGKCDPPGCPL